MARRTGDDASYLNAQRGFLTSGGKPKKAESFLIRFWRQQIMAPENREGNLSILWGISVFAGGILFAKTIGTDVLAPPL